MLTLVQYMYIRVHMKNKTDYIGSLAKGLRVIEAFNADRVKQSISDIAQETGFDRATSRRCLLTLHELGYADYDGKFFSLTPRVLRLGMGALATMTLPTVVQPWLDQLSEQIGQSCSVSILDDMEIVYVARAQQKKVMSIGLLPGSRLPAHCTSMGRVLLSALPDEVLHAKLQDVDLTPRTVNSLTRVDDLFDKICEVRTTGYALIDQEVELGLRSLAVPLYNNFHQVVAALNVGVAATHTDVSEMVDLYLDPLQRVQSGLERMLR